MCPHKKLQQASITHKLFVNLVEKLSNVVPHRVGRIVFSLMKTLPPFWAQHIFILATCEKVTKHQIPENQNYRLSATMTSSCASTPSTVSTVRHSRSNFNRISVPNYEAQTSPLSPTCSSYCFWQIGNYAMTQYVALWEVFASDILIGLLHVALLHLRLTKVFTRSLDLGACCLNIFLSQCQTNFKYIYIYIYM